MHHKGAFSLHMFFPSGDPDGLKIVKKDNWSGRLIAFQRDQLDDALVRDELSTIGVYVLRGPEGDPNDIDGIRIYVGQSSTLAARLEDHARKKEFWDHAVIITRTGDSLDRADALYLEARLIELADAGGLCILDNEHRPDPTGMLEADKEASAEGYLEDAVPCLSALGFYEFEQLEEPVTGPGTSDEEEWEEAVPTRVLRVTRNGVSIEAKAHRWSDREFEILEGSEALAVAGPAFLNRPQFKGYRRLRDQVLASDAVVLEGQKYRFTKNFTVKSPSAAEAIVAGRSGSGLAGWREIDESDDSEFSSNAGAQ